MSRANGGRIIGWYHERSKYACKNRLCQTVMKGDHKKCPRCGTEMVAISNQAKPPRRGQTAKLKKEWMIFYYLFAHWIPEKTRATWKLSPNGKEMGTDPYQYIKKNKPNRSWWFPTKDHVYGTKIINGKRVDIGDKK